MLMTVIYTLPTSNLWHWHRSQHANANFARDELRQRHPTARIVAILGRPR